MSEDVRRFGRYDIYECGNCGEQEKCKSMGHMTSSPVDSDRDCCNHPSYDKVGEESAYTVNQFQKLVDKELDAVQDIEYEECAYVTTEEILKRVKTSLNSAEEK